MKRLITTTLAAGLIASPLAAVAIPGYLVDSAGDIVHNSAGECWHTGAWTPELAVMGCDGKVAQATPRPAAAPTPAPQAAAPVPKAPMVLEAKTYFDFDRSALKPEATSSLDSFVSKIRGRTDVKAVHVTGYADRIGTRAYNLRLSQRRAAAVQRYLLDHRAVGPTRLRVSGRGEADPVVACSGIRGKRLIRCLAPNRRVEIQADIRLAGSTAGR